MEYLVSSTPAGLSRTPSTHPRRLHIATRWTKTQSSLSQFPPFFHNSSYSKCRLHLQVTFHSQTTDPRKQLFHYLFINSSILSTQRCTRLRATAILIGHQHSLDDGGAGKQPLKHLKKYLKKIIGQFIGGTGDNGDNRD